jgi:hypothetical protein
MQPQCHSEVVGERFNQPLLVLKMGEGHHSRNISSLYILEKRFSSRVSERLIWISDFQNYKMKILYCFKPISLW